MDQSQKGTTTPRHGSHDSHMTIAQGSHGSHMTSAQGSHGSHMTSAQGSHGSHMTSDTIQSEIQQIDSFLKALNTASYDTVNMATINQLAASKPPTVSSLGLSLIGQLGSDSSDSEGSSSSGDSDSEEMNITAALEKRTNHMKQRGKSATRKEGEMAAVSPVNAIGNGTNATSIAEKDPCSTVSVETIPAVIPTKRSGELVEDNVVLETDGVIHDETTTQSPPQEHPIMTQDILDTAQSMSAEKKVSSRLVERKSGAEQFQMPATALIPKPFRQSESSIHVATDAPPVAMKIDGMNTTAANAGFMNKDSKDSQLCLKGTVATATTHQECTAQGNHNPVIDQDGPNGRLETHADGTTSSCSAVHSSTIPCSNQVITQNDSLSSISVQSSIQPSQQPYTGEFLPLQAPGSNVSPSLKQEGDKNLPIPGIATAQLPNRMGQLTLTNRDVGGHMTTTQGSHGSHMTSAQGSHGSHMTSDTIQSEIQQIDSFLKALNTASFDAANMAAINQLAASKPETSQAPTNVPSVTDQSRHGTGDDSSGTSDSDESSESSDEDSVEMIHEAHVEESDDEGRGKKPNSNRGYPKTKGEIDYRDLPLQEECCIPFPENGKILPVGKVSHCTDKLVIVESLEGTPAVNEGTVLWSEEKNSIAMIFETFGPVKKPYYSLRVNSPEHAETLGLTPGKTVYVVPGDLNLTHYVFTHELINQKGTDASWKNDIEVPDELKDFSDDESEQKAHGKTKGKRREKVSDCSPTTTKPHHPSPRQPTRDPPSHLSRDPPRQPTRAIKQEPLHVATPQFIPYAHGHPGPPSHLHQQQYPPFLPSAMQQPHFPPHGVYPPPPHGGFCPAPPPVYPDMRHPAFRHPPTNVDMGHTAFRHPHPDVEHPGHPGLEWGQTQFSAHF